MANSQEYINQTTRMCKPILNNNTPSEYADSKTAYKAKATQLFASERAYLSADYVQADIQGLTDNFFEYTTTDIRMSDVTTNNVTSFDSKKGDDFKEILLPYYSYVPIGAKVRTMGSTWIVINPTNISSPTASAVIARCNVIYRHYDYYGNIIAEPIVVQKTSMLNNANKSPMNLELMNGHFNIIGQRNENTAELSENSRLILGKKAYEITGYTDFMQEFTEDIESCHLLSYTANVKEPTIYDDIDNRIADGLNYHFTANIEGQSTLSEEQTISLTAEFVINGKTIQSTDENPITWKWQSSDNNIAKVDNGNVTGKAEGTATITAILEQNTDITAEIEITVTEAQSEYIVIQNSNETAITQFNSVTYTAQYFVNSIEQSDIVKWEFSGADKSTYYATINGNSITIECIKPSASPLTLTASCNNSTSAITILLEGY